MRRSMLWGGEINRDPMSGKITCKGEWRNDDPLFKYVYFRQRSAISGSRNY